MHYFVDMYNNKMNFITEISEETCIGILDAHDSIQEILYFYSLGSCVRDAWDQLILFSNKTNYSGNYIIRNLHTAERLVRGFLFEFRTCLDHMETEIKRKYGESSTLWKLFAETTSNAYDSCPEYAFTSHLRNCSQHCKEVVHGFNGNTGIAISSNTKRLKTEYKKWKKVDLDFMESIGEEIDLLSTFSKTFSALNLALKPIIQYLLETNNTCDNLLHVHKYGDLLHNEYKHDIHCYHIVDIVFQDGKSATQNDIASGNVVVHAYPFDWDMIYELTNSLKKRE